MQRNASHNIQRIYGASPCFFSILWAARACPCLFACLFRFRQRFSALMVGTKDGFGINFRGIFGVFEWVLNRADHH
ncbi:hypothetical protein A11S_2294 [Micavibrio aeruginosavorus EPB]|uniref:Uncharacterized protein n=1 Tax=Micavibrio aeruginosavorus EPB TaxID=349215 RepID=M4W0Y7_9BACT|nr:hypothetical protein A11S_2294 [Micavibrio aeruginosavorus EPB]